MTGELDELGERIAEQAAHLDAAMHRLLADVREFDERGGWQAQGAASCAHWLAWRVGWDLVTARDHVRVARKLAEFPAIGDALRRGEVSYSKVRALVRVATPASEALLLDHARLMTASQLEKLCRKYALVQRHGRDPHPLGDEQRRYVRRRDTEDGMVKIEAVLHPEEAEMVWTMLDHAAAALYRDCCPDSGSPPQRDSTRSCEAAQARTSAAASPRELARFRRGTADDSAESPATAPVLPIAIAPPAGSHPSRLDCVAHAFEDPPAAAVTASGSPAWTEPGRLDDSAESRDQHRDAPMRSLLDRLLDEADALQDADTSARGDAVADVAEEADGTDGMDDSAAGSASEPGSPLPPSELRQRMDASRGAFSRADALVSLAQGYLRGNRPDRSPLELTLTIPRGSLSSGVTDPVEVGEMGEVFLSAETVRRLGCDAAVVEVIEDEHGVPLSVGRKRRTIAGALKRALHRRDGACTFPCCTNRIFLEGHHIEHWADGGETSLSNTALLCSLHHRFVHEYGYTIELGPDQRPRFRDARGRPVAAVPAHPAISDLGWPRICAVNEALTIDAGTISGPWDGTPVDYATIIGHLATAESRGYAAVPTLACQ